MNFFGTIKTGAAVATSASPYQNAYLKGLPTREMVRKDVDKWVDFLSVNNLQPTRSDFASGKISSEWTVEALSVYGEKILNAKVPATITDSITGKLVSSTFNLQDPVVNAWVSRGASLGNLALGGMPDKLLSGFSASTITQGTVVVEAFADGNISPEEIGPVLQSGGALAGGVVGSIIPGLGTLVGSAVGAVVGAIASVFAGPAMKRAQVQATNQRDIAAVAKWGDDQCKKVFSTLNSDIRKQIAELAHQWIAEEARLGFRFDLRWFDPNPGILFEDTARQASGTPGSGNVWGRIDSSSCLEKVVETRFQSGSVPHTWLHTDTRMDCNFYCPTDLGCRYPDQSASPVSTVANEYNLYGGTRVLTALRARGFEWPYPAGLCDYIAKTKPYASSTDEKQGETYAKQLQQSIQSMADYEKRRFEIARKIVAFDLARTTTTVETGAKIVRDQLELKTNGAFKAVSVLSGTLDEHADTFKTIAMIGGGSLLAYLLWKNTR